MSRNFSDVMSYFTNVKTEENEDVISALLESVFVLQIPEKEHNRPDCIAAKIKELQNLRNFETFEEVQEGDQTCEKSK